MNNKPIPIPCFLTLMKHAHPRTKKENTCCSNMEDPPDITKEIIQKEQRNININTNDSSYIEYTQSKITRKEFQFLFMDTPLYFQILCLKDSFFVWVGTKSYSLENLSVSVATTYSSVPSYTKLLGDHLDGFSSGLAQRLAKRTGKIFFISCGVPDVPTIQAYAEKKLLEFLKTENLLQ